MNDTEKLNNLFDRAAIIDLMARFAVSIDTRDWLGFSRCFAAMVEFDYADSIGEVRMAATELQQVAPSFFERLDATQHISANHQVEINGDSAVCVSTLHAQHFLSECPGGSVQRQIGYYRNLLERSECDGWRITRSEQQVLWNEGNAAVFAHAADQVVKP